MSKPGRYDFAGADAIYQGDDLSFVVTLTDDTGTAVDLSAATIAMMVRTAPGETLLVNLSSYWSLTTDGTDGSATLTVPGSVTSALDITTGAPQGGTPPTYRFWHDIQTTIGGVVKTWLMGTFDIMQETTTP